MPQAVAAVAGLPLSAPGVPATPLGLPGAPGVGPLNAPGPFSPNAFAPGSFIEPPPLGTVPVQAPGLPTVPAEAPGVTIGGVLGGALVILTMGIFVDGDAHPTLPPPKPSQPQPQPPPDAGIRLPQLLDKGYKSFEDFKNDAGSVRPDFDWHHIVEQGHTNATTFPPEQLHNWTNLIPVDLDTHRKITNFYGSRTADPRSKGAPLRDWLRGQDWETQKSYGIDVLRRFGVIP